jgi:transcriptional regulator with XRE-family HTH domain
MPPNSAFVRMPVGIGDKPEASGSSDHRSVGATTRTLDEAARRAARQRRELGDEFRERRLSLGLSQAHVARVSRMSRNHFGQIENGACSRVTVAEVNAIAAVLGLAPSLRIYPAGPPVRDAGQATRLREFLSLAAHPLTYGIEIPLANVADRPDRRAWDAVIFNGQQRCAIELEMRLRDVQAARRRIELKRRDDPSDRFLLLVADTAYNRRVLSEFDALFADLLRLRPSRVHADLRSGHLPPSGLLLV